MNLISFQNTNFLLVSKDFCNFTIDFRNLIKCIIKISKFINDKTNGEHEKYTQVHAQVVTCKTNWVSKIGQISNIINAINSNEIHSDGSTHKRLEFFLHFLHEEFL